MSDTLFYESKCRRCGTFHKWAWGVLGWNELHAYVWEHLTFPVHCSCDSKTCKGQHTFQDITMYSDKPQNKTENVKN